MKPPSTTRVIGIIGPPCSGKSTIAKYLQSLGGVWLDADKIAKQQLDAPEVIAELVDVFGQSILGPDGSSPSRQRIADLVFGDDDESHARLKQLESIIHPRTRAVIHTALVQSKADNDPFVILDVPLLLESHWETECDEVWCVSVSLHRHAILLAVRGWDAEELARRQSRQLPWDEKRRRSDWVIENNGTPEELQLKVRARLDQTTL